jgi:hypothetical protein
MFIPDPDFFPFRIPGSKSTGILDPDPQHWCQLYLLLLLAAAKDAAPRDIGEDDGDKEENDGDSDHRHGDVHDVRGARLQGRDGAHYRSVTDPSYLLKVMSNASP